MKNVKKLFKTISGRPKSGNIVECIRPIPAIAQTLFATYLFYFGITREGVFVQLIVAAAAIMVAWQIGWGMSIERFRKNETPDKLEAEFEKLLLEMDKVVCDEDYSPYTVGFYNGVAQAYYILTDRQIERKKPRD